MQAGERREPSIYIHPVQRNNPFFPFARASVEEREMAVDYFFPSLSTGLLFLSFEYHCHAPLYLARKLERLRGSAEAAEIGLLVLCLVADAPDGQDYILDLQLRRLTKFSRIELEAERDELQAAIAELEAILASDARLREVVSAELQAVAAEAEAQAREQQRTELEAAQTIARRFRDMPVL